MQIFECTPFGIYCRLCKNHVGASHQMITKHLLVKEHGFFSKEDIKAFKTIAEKEVERLSRQPNLQSYLVDCCSEGFVCGCGTPFQTRKLLVGHINRSKSCKFKLEDARSELLYKTVCGRTVSKATLDRLRSLRRTAVQVDYKPTEEALLKYIRADESIDPYINLFQPIFASSRMNYDLVLDQMVIMSLRPAADEEPVLNQVLEAAETYLKTFAKRHVRMVPGNLRAGLQVFDGQDVSEVKQNVLYTFRNNVRILIPELKRLLSFMWRHPGNLLSYFKHTANITDPDFIPGILEALLLQQLPGLREHTWVAEYCAARCFRKTANRIEMIQCGDVASIIASVASILRAGACSFMIFADWTDKQREDFVNTIRNGRVLNIVSPMIRELRDMQREKPNRQVRSVTPEGDIAIDGFNFPRREWSQSVPRLVAVCRELFGALFETEDWSLFMDVNTPLSVSRDGNGQFLFSISIAGKKVESKQLQLKREVNHIPIIDRLGAYAEICIHGFGGGSLRMQEVMKLTLLHANWHRGTIYYTSQSIKKFSHRSRTAKKCEHKLPAVVARLFLLYRQAARLILLAANEPMSEGEATNAKRLIPTCGECFYTMPKAFGELWVFAEKIGALQIRQFWTSVCNVTFPSGQTEIVTATRDVAEMSGHTEGTHAARYGSVLIITKIILHRSLTISPFSSRYGSAMVGATELNFRKYHEAIGAYEGTSISTEEIQEVELLQALKNLFGRHAQYMSDLQRDMVLASCRPRIKHLHIGLSCGGGKNLAYLLPVVAAAMFQKTIGMQIIVMPYNFLVCSLENSARESLQKQFDVSIESITTRELSNQSLPALLADDENLPDLVFVSLDAFVALFTNHSTSLSRWESGGKIHQIIIDEIHTIYGEIFRVAYQRLSELARFKIPIMTLSGTIPRTLVKQLSCHLNMTLNGDGSDKDNGSDMDVIASEDLLGRFPSGFTIACGCFPSILKGAMKRARQILTSVPQFSLHMICASRKNAGGLFEALSRHYKKIGLVTGKTDPEELAIIAGKWSRGELDILISTSAGLVGNECSRCQAVLIVGYLFNLMAVVQAMGRLRPKQRTKSGCIEIFLNLTTSALLDTFAKRDQNACGLLLGKSILTQKCLEPFNAVGTFRGLHDWAVNDTGCRIMALNRRFGNPLGTKCNVCDKCRGSPVAHIAVMTSAQVSSNVSMEHEALRVLRHLKTCCMVCQAVRCVGECKTQGKCYKCGSNHPTKTCTTDFSNMLQARGCYYCLDLHDRRDYETHEVRTCPLKRRLRRMIIDAYHRRKGKPMKFDSFATSILCDNNHFYAFIANYRSANVVPTKSAVTKSK
jgi:superfamily II DNA helicase RecQ